MYTNFIEVSNAKRNAQLKFSHGKLPVACIQIKNQNVPSTPDPPLPSPLCPFQAPRMPPGGNLYSDFYCPWLISPVFELCVMETT